MSEELNLLAPTYILDLYKNNPEWFEGYVQGLNHALRMGKDSLEHKIEEYTRVIEVMKNEL
jgi:hypothetical protein